MPIGIDFEGAGYVKLRGCPYSATQADVSAFFNGQVSEDQVTLGVNRERRPSGEAWVQFASQAVAEEAMASKQKQEMGGRYIEIFLSTSHEVAQAIQRKRGCTRPLEGPPGSAFLRLRGLPFTSDEAAVAGFLAEFGVSAASVTLGTDGARPSGEAWVVFPSPEIAERAKLAMNKQILGGRYINIYSSSQQDVGKSQPQFSTSWNRGYGFGKGYGGYGKGGYGKGGFGFGNQRGGGGGRNRGGPNLARTPLGEVFATGCVQEWKGHFGWITPSAPVEHAAAGQRSGNLYVHKQDLMGGLPELAAGSTVQFKVYHDSSGLGAQEVSVVG